MKHLIIVALSAMTILPAYAADTLKIKDFRHVGPLELREPVVIDSVDAKGETYDVNRLLDSYQNLTVVRQGHLLQGVELPGVSDGQKRALHLVGFDLNSYSFQKGNLSFGKKPAHSQIYLDGKQLYDFNNLSLEPGKHEVVLKYMAEADKTDSLEVMLVMAEGSTSPVLDLDTPNRYTVKGMMDTRTFGNLNISPKGDYLYYTYWNHVGESWNTVRRMRNLRTGVERQIEKFDNWMPSSNRYFYLRNGLEGRELVSVDPATDEEQIVAQHLPEGWIVWLPNEQQMIIGNTIDGQAELNKDVFEVIHPDDRQPGWRNRTNLSLYDIRTGVLQPLLYGYHRMWLADVSADSRYALVSISYDCWPDSAVERPSRPTEKQDLLRLDLQTMKVDTLYAQEGFASGANFSPDGKQVCVVGSPEAFDRIGCTLPEDKIPSMFDYQAYIIDVDTKEVHPVTRDFDPSVSSTIWSKADGMIYIKAENQDSVSMYRLDPKSGDISRVALPEEMIRSFDLPQQGTMVTFCGQSATNGDRLYVADLAKVRVQKGGGVLQLAKAPTVLHDLHALNCADMQLAECHPWRFNNSVGDEVLCRYYLPVGYDATKADSAQYPMITYYYGGCSPTGRSFEFSYPWQIWAAQGYVVLVVQPSGCAGRGQEWASRHVNTAGEGPARDIIEAVQQFCQTHTFVNAKKVGCCGASYGGFMTQYLQTVTDIFACATSHAGISDHTTYWGYGYWGYSYSQVSMANSYPWSEMELYVKQSPLYNVDKIHTPILFLHGTKDTNVPINNSIQMYTALRLLGRETSLVCVEGENHGISAYNKRAAWLKTSMAWFQKHLKDDPTWWNALYPQKKL